MYSLFTGLRERLPTRHSTVHWARTPSTYFRPNTSPHEWAHSHPRGAACIVFESLGTKNSGTGEPPAHGPALLSRWRPAHQGLFSETSSLGLHTVHARSLCTCRSRCVAAVRFIHLIPSSTPSFSSVLSLDHSCVPSRTSTVTHPTVHCAVDCCGPRHLPRLYASISPLTAPHPIVFQSSTSLCSAIYVD
jgi:hypothetical protein